MRIFLRAHWKALVAIVLLVVLALFTVSPGAAVPEIPLASRLRAHVAAIDAGERGAATPARRERAARYIEDVLRGDGYAIRRQRYQAGGPHAPRLVRNIEVAVSNLAPGARPTRIFIVGARCDPAPGDDDGSGTAAVLELARLLKDLRPSQGTEVKFVFFIDEEPSWSRDGEPGSAQRLEDAPAPHDAGWYALRRHGRKLPPGAKEDAARPDTGSPDAGSFIAYVGTLESSRRVQDALSAFRATSDLPSYGLAAPAYVQGVTLSGHASYGHAGYPAVMVTDTAFLRYPYYKMDAGDQAGDTPGSLDYTATARVLEGLARTIVALAAGAQG
ncbi:M28 family peptidase [Massilia sp. 2TAF26]|uniref:M28 family peptidase n=1 Tax=Massilia sp. 2TAF26 TaxID=3233012 RepID=UPI003F94BF41